MSAKTAKHYSEAKTTRVERKFLVGFNRYHKNCVRRFNRSDRQTTKANLKAFIG